MGSGPIGFGQLVLEMTFKLNSEPCC